MKTPTSKVVTDIFHDKVKILTSRKVITDILLDKPLDYWHDDPKYGGKSAAHVALADKIRDWQLYSFIGGMVPLADELFLFKNKKVTASPFVAIPKIRQLARKEVKYTSMDVIRAAFDKFDIPQYVKESSVLFTEYADMWFAADEEKLFPKIISDYLQAASYDEDDKKLKGKALEKSIATAMEELFQPEVYPRLERSTKHLPKIIRQWAGVWNQWYVAVTPEKTLVAMGSYKGSGTRETHGYYGHAFALLALEGKVIPTFYIGLDQNGVPILHKKVDGFKVVGQDLDGNYRDGLKHEEQKKFFKDMLVYVRDGKVYEV